MNEISQKVCKYCTQLLEDSLDEGLDCTICKESVHLRCLQNSALPGGLNGDIFFIFTCQQCSINGKETFVRDKISWLKVLVLVLYHLQTRSPGLARKGYFHWKNHVAALIDKNWDILFPSDFKKKKKWVGTIAGTLSHFNNFFFKSGTAVINEPAWWALVYPKLTPNVISNIYSAFNLEKQKAKILKTAVIDSELFQQVLQKIVKNPDLLATNFPTEPKIIPQPKENHDFLQSNTKKQNFKPISVNKRKTLLPTFESTSKKLLKLGESSQFPSFSEELPPPKAPNITNNRESHEVNTVKLLDPMCHYNTSLSDTSRQKGHSMKIRLMGGIRKELILSPYSAIYLKPYIRRDTETYPLWLQLMTGIQLKANEKNYNYQLPSRAPLDYTYVQPEHIPAIHSLLNQFFWPGIDLTDCLQYPDFSCVVMYKKLIVAFGFVVPNVGHTENYLSFLFTRPGWRNVGIAKFIVYHLIQTGLGKDLTLHVSINNPALFLYQKFGFKVEAVDLHFYDKYIRSDTKESKHAFFCRLER